MYFIFTSNIICNRHWVICLNKLIGLVNLTNIYGKFSLKRNLLLFVE